MDIEKKKSEKKEIEEMLETFTTSLVETLKDMFKEKFDMYEAEFKAQGRAIRLLTDKIIDLEQRLNEDEEFSDGEEKDYHRMVRAETNVSPNTQVGDTFPDLLKRD